ncbi:MAG TPA: class I SAM-dependent methyltransferase [Bryobacteraceae bacterium]|nr:class I SAM-dependent methyltransferase [Bryobacteraceae bacterium]
MTVASTMAEPRYQFKGRPYSSHVLLLSQFPTGCDGRRVLDVGCAQGYLAEILAGRGFDVTGVDLPGTPHGDSFRFVAGDLDAGLPALEGAFDFILCADVLEHLRDPLAMLRDCRRLLAPGGRLIASLPNSGHLYFRWNVLMGRFPRHDKGLFDRTHLQFYVWDGWVDLLARAGFRIEDTRVSGVPVGLALPGWEGSAAVRFLEWMSFRLACLRKTLFAYQFIVRAQPESVA